MSTAAYLGLLALGLGAGAFGTLIGAGGGFLLMPLLLVLYPHDSAQTLTSISLAVVFFNALSGTQAYAMAKRIDYRSALLFSAATLPGAVLGALNTASIPRRGFDLILGVAVLAAAAFLGFKKGREEGKATHAGMGGANRTIIDAHGHAWTYSFNPGLGVGVSLLVGYVSSFLGIGGGIIHVPLMVYALGFPVHVATATSHFILAVMSFTGTVTHVFAGSYAHGLHRTVPLAIGVVIGAQLGARLSDHIGGRLIVRLLGVGLAVLGIRVLLLGMGVWQ